MIQSFDIVKLRFSLDEDVRKVQLKEFIELNPYGTPHEAEAFLAASNGKMFIAEVLRCKTTLNLQYVRHHTINYPFSCLLDIGNIFDIDLQKLKEDEDEFATQLFKEIGLPLVEDYGEYKVGVWLRGETMYSGGGETGIQNSLSAGQLCLYNDNDYIAWQYEFPWKCHENPSRYVLNEEETKRWREDETYRLSFGCVQCCRNCSGHWIERPDTFVDVSDSDLCPVCRGRKFVLPYHRNYPRLTFWATKGETLPDNYYGIEIEAAYGGESNDTAKWVAEHMNKEDGKWFMYSSHDGSLDRGLEFITCPATLKYHKKMRPKYKELFSELIRRGYQSHNTHCCGIHVHFSRSYYADDGHEEENIAKLLYLVERFWDEIILFSRRDYRTCAKYAKKTDADHTRFIDKWNRTSEHDGHYYAVNIANQNTIELRMFRGTLNIDSFMVILEFVDRLVTTAKEKSLEELQKLSFADLLTKKAKEYYKARLAIAKYTNEGMVESEPERYEEEDDENVEE